MDMRLEVDEAASLAAEMYACTNCCASRFGILDQLKLVGDEERHFARTGQTISIDSLYTNITRSAWKMDTPITQHIYLEQCKAEEIQDTLCTRCSKIIDHISGGACTSFSRGQDMYKGCTMCKFLQSLLYGGSSRVSIYDPIYDPFKRAKDMEFISGIPSEGIPPAINNAKFADFVGLLSVTKSGGAVTIHDFNKTPERSKKNQARSSLDDLLSGIRIWLQSTMNERESGPEYSFQTSKVRGRLGRPQAFHLIDCHDLCLFKTQYADHPQYAALSYVW
jgi:hypothetical protein